MLTLMSIILSILSIMVPRYCLAPRLMILSVVLLRGLCHHGRVQGVENIHEMGKNMDMEVIKCSFYD